MRRAGPAYCLSRCSRTAPGATRVIRSTSSTFVAVIAPPAQPLGRGDAPASPRVPDPCGTREGSCARRTVRAGGAGARPRQGGMARDEPGQELVGGPDRSADDARRGSAGAWVGNSLGAVMRGTNPTTQSRLPVRVETGEPRVGRLASDTVTGAELDHGKEAQPIDRGLFRVLPRVLSPTRASTNPSWSRTAAASPMSPGLRCYPGTRSAQRAVQLLDRACWADQPTTELSALDVFADFDCCFAPSMVIVNIFRSSPRGDLPVDRRGLRDPHLAFTPIAGTIGFFGQAAATFTRARSDGGRQSRTPPHTRLPPRTTRPRRDRGR